MQRGTGRFTNPSHADRALWTVFVKLQSPPR